MSNQNLTRIRGNHDEIESFLLGDPDLNSYGYYGESPNANEKRQIFKLLAILRKYWLLIVLVPLVVTASAFVYEAQKQDFYKAETRIQVNNEANPASGATNGGAAVVFAPTNDPGYFTTQLQILEGSGLLRRVTKTLDLEHNPSYWAPRDGRKFTVWENVLRMAGLYKPQVASNKESQPGSDNQLSLNTQLTGDPDKEAEKLAPFVGSLQRSLTVMPVMDGRTANPQTRLIEVEVVHHDPVMAAKIANTVADVYVLHNLEQKVQTNANAGDFLQKRVAELQSQIRVGEERLINYAKSNQILSLDATQNTVVQRLSDLNGKLGQAENDRITAEAAYRAALQNPMLNQTAESRDARTSGLQAQLTTLRQQLDQLKAEYTDEWPAVISTKRQIENIEKELASTRKRAADTQIAGLEQTYREASARERELRANFGQQRNEVLTQNEAAIYYRIIQQEIETNKKLLDGLLQTARATEVLLNGTPNNVHIVDRALAPGSPAGPQRSKNIILAFLASLTFAMGLSFLLGWLDDTVRQSEDLEAATGLPVIGLIPGASGGFGKRLLPAFFNRETRNRSGQRAYNLENFEKPLLREAYHQLRTSLLLSNPGGPAQTILVTSGRPGEGKTITSFNLAKSLSELGNRVLLIDADLRSPQVHAIVGIDQHSGLSTLLTVKTVDQELLDRSIRKDPTSDLFVLPAGPNSPNPANLLSSNEMRNLLTRLAGQFSYIVIDSPPVLYFADSVILSNNVNGVMLVARANFTSQQIILQAKKMLEDVRAKILGVVLNDIPLSGYKYYPYDYYGQLEAPAAANGNGNGLLNLEK
jgi:polysaccharide biosynthesis transport protein